MVKVNGVVMWAKCVMVKVNGVMMEVKCEMVNVMVWEGVWC